MRGLKFLKKNVISSLPLFTVLFVKYYYSVGKVSRIKLYLT